MKYTGPLAKPIRRRPISLLRMEESAKEAAGAEVNEMFDKLPALFTAHGITEHDWFGLAFALAKEHVLGFKLVDPPGRKTQWAASDKAEFRLDVEAIRSAKRKTLDRSIHDTVKADRWLEKTKGMKIAALRQHYYAADPRMAQIVRDARAFDALPEEVKRAVEEGRFEDAWQMLETERN